MRHLSMFKTAEEINRLRQLVANQKDTIEKALKVIEQLADDCCRLQAENDKLNDTCAEYRHSLEMYFRLLDKYKADNAKLRAALTDEDIIFPNTDERGLGDGDTPSDLSPFDL